MKAVPGRRTSRSHRTGKDLDVVLGTVSRIAGYETDPGRPEIVFLLGTTDDVRPSRNGNGLTGPVPVGFRAGGEKRSEGKRKKDRRDGVRAAAPENTGNSETEKEKKKRQKRIGAGKTGSEKDSGKKRDDRGSEYAGKRHRRAVRHPTTGTAGFSRASRWPSGSVPRSRTTDTRWRNGDTRPRPSP